MNTHNPFQWDKQGLFVTPNGKSAVRFADSDRDGVAVEISMHDPTIQSMYPMTYWLPVFSAPVNNARIDRVDGWLVVLFGFGKLHSDPTGNLSLVRVSVRPGFSPDRLKRILTMIYLMFLQFGIQLNSKMAETIRGN